MSEISKVFNIPENYNLEELKNSYVNILKKLSKSENKSKIEKKLLSDQYTKLYYEGKQLYNNKTTVPNLYNGDDKMQELAIYNPSENITKQFFGFNKTFDNILSQFDEMSIKNSQFDKLGENNKSQVYTFSSMTKSSSNPDGSVTVINSKSESKNGDKKNLLNAYKKLPDGKIIPLTDGELKKIKY